MEKSFREIIGDIVGGFVKGYRKGKALRRRREEEANCVTTCDLGHTFNARWQSGICPHLAVSTQISAEGQPMNPVTIDWGYPKGFIGDKEETH